MKTPGVTYHSPDEGQVLGHHVFKVVSDEDPAHVHLDVVHLLAIVLEHVCRRCLGHKQDRLEGHLPLGSEVCLCHWLLAVLAKALVELIVLVICDVTGPATDISMHWFQATGKEMKWAAKENLSAVVRAATKWKD